MPRWNRRQTEQVYAVTTLTSESAPTVAQIVAGERLDTSLRSLTGFTFTSTDLDASDMSSTWPKSIPGPDDAPDSSMTFYEGDDAADDEEAVRTLLAKGANLFIVFCPRGAPTATEPARVWPVRVKSNVPDETADNATATFTVGYSIPDPPTLNAVIAA